MDDNLNKKGFSENCSGGKTLMTNTAHEAPERIWMDPDIKFPECEKQYGSDVEYVRADRIEELEERLKAATNDAKEAEDYAEELEAKLKTVVEDKVDVVVKLTRLQTYLEDFFTLLDKKEETDDGRVFRPNHINSCRAEDGQKLENLLRLMKATVGGRW